MTTPKWIPPLFWLAALYDGILGLAFLAAPGPLFDLCQVTPPNHLGYVQFPAALLLIFGLMFAAIAGPRRPAAPDRVRDPAQGGLLQRRRLSLGRGRHPRHVEAVRGDRPGDGPAVRSGPT